MEKLKKSSAAKIIAMILVIVSIAVSCASLAGMLMIDAVGGYQTSEEELLKEAYKKVCYNYSVAAMSEYEEDFKKEELSQTNFRYGVIKAGQDDEADLTDLDSYLVKNFDTVPDENERYVYDCYVNENTWFAYGENIWEDFYADTSDEAEVWYTDEEYPLDEFYYDRDTEIIYVRSGNKLFQILEGGVVYSLTADDMPDQDYGLLDNSYMERKETEEGAGYEWNEEYGAVVLDHGSMIRLSDIQIISNLKQAGIGKVTEDIFNYFDDDKIYVAKRHVAEPDHYKVVSYIPSARLEDVVENDMFWQSYRLVDFAYRMRYPAIALMALSAIVLVLSFTFLMSAAGCRRNQEGICLRLLDHIPLDVYLGCVVVAEILLFLMFGFCGSRLTSWSENQASGYVSFGVITLCIGITAILIAVAYCMSFAVRIKLGKWWKHTLIYWMCRVCMKALTSCVRFCLNTVRGILQSMTLLWKAWLVLGGIAFVEFFTIMVCEPYWTELVFFWMIEKIVLYPVMILLLMQMNKLQKGAQRIANGELGYRIPTDRMFWEMKKHGEYLNDIGIGINRAVNERLKSEHFKTELITNVSHDIKTPLTSIINYADLLQKEEIDNPTALEYLEVLNRQSARLKKLIEDLMEASKASTGNLNVIFEKCDTGVMLVQTVGEFEEKLMENQIELQIKRPEGNIDIEADNRHLWRVFDNLMNNICKYAQPNTRAYINLEQDEQRAYIIFRNISKYQLNISSEELMERFVRGDSSRNTEGSGLGISIAKSLTELMNGTFDLVVDGDLFKVILSFQLYGVPQIRKEQSLEYDQNQCAGMIEWTPEEKEKQRHNEALERITTGIQSAGAHVAGFGSGVADKTGRMFRRAGRFAHHVRQAAEQVMAEEEELEKSRADK